jgi:hypothetical protein
MRFYLEPYNGVNAPRFVLAGHVLRATSCVFGIPDFRLYALADAIRQFLCSQAQGLKRLLELQSTLPVQPTLFDS